MIQHGANDGPARPALMPAEDIEYEVRQSTASSEAVRGWCNNCGLATPYKIDVSEHVRQTGHVAYLLSGWTQMFWRQRVSPVAPAKQQP